MKQQQTASDPECSYCEDTGYIGSPLDFDCTPCTDCEIWWNKIKGVKFSHDTSKGMEQQTPQYSTIETDGPD